MSQNPQDRPARYHLFLLSLWETGSGHPGEPAVWRLSLQDPHTSERKGFADLAELDAFLAAWMGNRENGG